jgi:hypothetical protein
MPIEYDTPRRGQLINSGRDERLRQRDDTFPNMSGGTLYPPRKEETLTPSPDRYSDDLQSVLRGGLAKIDFSPYSANKHARTMSGGARAMESVSDWAGDVWDSIAERNRQQAYSYRDEDRVGPLELIRRQLDGGVGLAHKMAQEATGSKEALKALTEGGAGGLASALGYSALAASPFIRVVRRGGKLVYEISDGFFKNNVGDDALREIPGLLKRGGPSVAAMLGLQRDEKEASIEHRPEEVRSYIDLLEGDL